MRKVLTAAFLVATLCLGSVAQADIFLANLDGSTTFDLSMGNSGTIGVYVSDDISINSGAFLDAFGGDGISITGAVVFNPDIVENGTATGKRWQSPFSDGVSGTVEEVCNDEAILIVGQCAFPSDTTPAFLAGEDPIAWTNWLGFSGFNVFGGGTGIIPDQATGGQFEDTGHVDGLGFLFAELTWELNGSADLGGDNIATIELGIGSGLIVNDGAALNPEFGNYTITNAVPEPSSAGMLALGLLGLVTRRRR